MNSMSALQSVNMKLTKRNHAAFLLAAILGLMGSPPAGSAADDAPAILIRPANYDPNDEAAYTRERGELSPGMVASGKIWNKPVDDSRAAVSGAAPAPAEAVGAEAPVPAASGTPVLRMTYAEAYASVPFSRSEYEANPSYRHDAAMEIMFGQLRPMTVIRQTIPYFSRYPDMFRYRYPVFPYTTSTGGYSNLNMNWGVSLLAY